MKLFKILLVLFLLGIFKVAGAQSQDDSLVTAPGVHPTPLWAAAQLVPSLQWHFPEDDDSRFGLRWQITPLLFSFGLNRHVSPWRTLVAEPLARYNGSLELYVSPEYASDMPAKWNFRGGIRGYLPIYRYGEYVAASVGTSYYNNKDYSGISYEAGIYIFFGMLGLQVQHSPGYKEGPWTLTLSIRYF
jgi:hypothetical protein